MRAGPLARTGGRITDYRDFADICVDTAKIARVVIHKMDPNTFQVLITVLLSAVAALLSVVATLTWMIYTDLRRRVNRMERQMMACLSTLIAIVNHIQHLPEHILKDLHEALKANE
jgi:GAF domain-containing protein